MKDPKSILVVVPRRLGDVLLTTPLIRTLKRGYPEAFIDVLVFQGTGSILEGNPDVRRIWEVPPKLSLAESFLLLRRIWNRYDLAISTMIGDKPTLYAFAAGRQRVGTVPHKGHWKSRMFHVAVSFDNVHTHTVIQNLKLAIAIGLTSVLEVVPPYSNEFDKSFLKHESRLGINRRYVVFHPFPKYEYKKWPSANWIELGRKIQKMDVQIVVSGSADQEEQTEAGLIAKEIPGAINLAGQIRICELTTILKNALAYVGTDTSVTHLAAATGVKTMALFGPTNPVKWGPWPLRMNENINPWQRVGTQQRENVFLLQGLGACVPCAQEGCERHVNSKSQCLHDLTVDFVYQLLYKEFMLKHT